MTSTDSTISSLQQYNMSCVSSGDNQELKDYINRMYERIRPYVEQDRARELNIFVMKLKKAFRRREHNMPFLLGLRGLLQKYDYDITKESDVEEKDLMLKRFQDILDDAKVSNLCLSFFLENTEPELISTSADVLILLLTKGNRDVQISILKQLKQGNLGFCFMNYIKSQLWTYITNYDEVNQARKEGGQLKLDQSLNRKMLQQGLIIELIKLAQLLCENVFSDFQVAFTSESISKPS